MPSIKIVVCTSVSYLLKYNPINGIYLLFENNMNKMFINFIKTSKSIAFKYIFINTSVF